VSRWVLHPAPSGCTSIWCRFFLFRKRPQEHFTARVGLAAAGAFSSPPSFLETLWVSFSWPSSRRCRAVRRRKPCGPTPGPCGGACSPPQEQLFPGAGSRDAPRIGLTSCSLTRGALAAGSRFLAGGEQAAVGVAGIGFQGWQGRPAEAREGARRANVFREGEAKPTGASGSCSWRAGWEQ